MKLTIDFVPSHLDALAIIPTPVVFLWIQEVILRGKPDLIIEPGFVYGG